MDKNKFKAALIDASIAKYLSLIAYCLMDNHVHLVIRENEEKP